jgi:hypothetical protein
MRKKKVWLALTVLVGLAGCNTDGAGRVNLLNRPNGGVKPAPSEVPQVVDLVAYLNNNAQGIPGIQSDDVTLTCQQGLFPKVTLTGLLRCQGPRNFRLGGNLMGSREVDLGSNDQEFWYWIKRGDPFQVYCSYQALEQGQVQKLPFPFQPDWVLEAMGMGKYGPADRYQLSSDDTTLKLIERTRSPQGQMVKKVIVFNRNKAVAPNQPQITAFLLLDDATNKEICSCHISERLIIANKGEIPRKFELRWPEQKLTLGIRLDGVTANAQIPPQVFVRTPLKGVESLNLATLKFDGSVQRAGAGQTPVLGKSGPQQ